MMNLNIRSLTKRFAKANWTRVKNSGRKTWDYLRDKIQEWKVRPGQAWCFSKRQVKRASKSVIHWLPITIEEDILINEFWWSFGFRPLVCGLAGVAIASAVWLAVAVATWFGFFGYNFISIWLWLGMATVPAFLFAQNEEDADGNPIVEKVPQPNFGALVTWRGMVVRFGTYNLVRTTGDYPWTGKALGFSRTTKTDTTFTDTPEASDGFINRGTIQMKIWNKGDHENPNTTITGNAKNVAVVTGTLTLSIIIKKPSLLLLTTDATLKVADRARQAYRELLVKFVDNDLLTLNEHKQEIIEGKRTLTCFLPKSVGSLKTGSMIRDRGGIPMIKTLKPGDNLEEAMIEFAQEVKLKADKDQLKAVTAKVARVNTVTVSVVQIHDPITDVIKSIGGELEAIIFGDMAMSAPVTEAANNASAEAKQREGEIEDAKTRVMTRQILLPTMEELDNPGFELAQILESQRSGNKQAQVVYAAGTSNPLVAPAVAAASIIQGARP
jgi:hypothetical protein